jgi:hypothetical protein
MAEMASIVVTIAESCSKEIISGKLVVLKKMNLDVELCL